MTGAWEYSLFIAQSYDRQIGKKYDHNLARYTMHPSGLCQQGY